MAKTAATKTSVLPMLWRRYNIGDLSVAPSVAGAVHRFTIGARPIEIRLPKRPRRSEQNRGFFSNERIHRSSMRGGRPASFEVTSVDLYVTLSRRVKVRDDALLNQNSDFTERERTIFERMISPANEAATEALDRWLRVLRWKARSGSIGQRRILDLESGWGAYLFDADTRKKFYAGTVTFTTKGSNPITRRTWNETGRSLVAGALSPVWFDFLFEGEHRLSSDDLHGGIICLAIACESLIRVLMTKHLRRPMNEKYAALVNHTSISGIVNQWKATHRFDFATKSLASCRVLETL